MFLHKLDLLKRRENHLSSNAFYKLTKNHCSKIRYLLEFAKFDDLGSILCEINCALSKQEGPVSMF